jgi:hypothetical protein
MIHKPGSYILPVPVKNPQVPGSVTEGFWTDLPEWPAGRYQIVPMPEYGYRCCRSLLDGEAGEVMGYLAFDFAGHPLSVGPAEVIEAEERLWNSLVPDESVQADLRYTHEHEGITLAAILEIMLDHGWITPNWIAQALKTLRAQK